MISQPEQLRVTEQHAEIRADALMTPFSPEALVPHVRTEINTSTSLYDARDVQETLGFRASVPVSIKAGSKQLMVVDLRHVKTNERGHRIIPIHGKDTPLQADFLVLSPSEWDLTDKSGYKGLRAGTPLVFGRTAPKLRERFDFSDETVSRQHFKLEYADSSLFITDLGSRNKTVITRPDHRISDPYTGEAVKRYRSQPGYQESDSKSPYGYLDGYPIIGRHSPSMRGIYLCGSYGEAMVVDPERDPHLDAAYQSLNKLVTAKLVFDRVVGRGHDTEAVLEQVMNYTKSLMRYDGPAIEAIEKHYKGERKILLGDYIEWGIGVCRQQGLLAAYFLERLVDDKKLHGRFGVERNVIPEYGDGHAWAVFRETNGLEYVVDPAQSFVGTKKQARQQPLRWDYYLPLDVI
ncbi:MAG TPA: FHA domain-containing protein [Candidatus Saccharimonadales bacterium]|nr:FHA domain-containing protein [Candidatus Saccharimonadales bacterium]